jgi:PIN domain nuclease of toxin-antitoxin system
MGRSLLILLDTHVVIWLAQDYQHISRAAQTAISDARSKDRGLAVADITPVEIPRLASHGRINLIPDAEAVLSEVDAALSSCPSHQRLQCRHSRCRQTIPKIPWTA